MIRAMLIKPVALTVTMHTAGPNLFYSVYPCILTSIEGRYVASCFV